MVNAYSSATELAAAIKAKEVSSRELTDLYIDRVERYDSEINAILVCRVNDFYKIHEKDYIWTT